ncbi:thiamine-phosphate pyrophosphorylase [Caldimicrobium thiodismutans]|uniref:Thiamine-phosphate synthase n=1 Tax=Caldimicrobium thiodismutans TaxID=1653476 RepID=A0A0U5AIF9_9BACT|nr:thiamine phosphate synthase [Caldimicrobium thiodismutans]BAU23708.1 thiamine-phosphate pyrophosphorylase [Caldimicrobium thiodismutans]
MEREKTKLFGLYVITDEKLTPYEGEKIFKCVESALKGGAKVVQLRDKTHTDEELLEVALQLKKLCHQYQALFIVNDRVKLAKGVEADGVHLGIEDEALERVKVALPDKIIGVSCYGDLERAKRAEALGASYVAFGSFFPSPTKPASALVSKEILLQAKKELKIPVCAIGGITLEQAEELIKLGADLLAVISDIWLARDIEDRARGYTELFRKYRKI